MSKFSLTEELLGWFNALDVVESVETLLGKHCATWDAAMQIEDDLGYLVSARNGNRMEERGVPSIYQ